MNDRNVYIKSFGCQMNKLDTALVSSALKEAGFGFCQTPESADAVVINTCSVREHAEKKVYSHLGNLKNLKQQKPDLVVAVMGCMAQRLGEELLAHDSVDIVCGPAHIPMLADMITQSLTQKQKHMAVNPDIRKTQPSSDQLEDFETIHDHDDKDIPGQAWVRAMRGCNNFCTYCIVPYTRGPEVSRPPQVILEQIKRLAGEGVKLVTLLGQTVNSYEYKAGEKTYCLADVLEMASEIDGIEWLRFVTNYPQQKYLNEIMTAMRDNEKICNYLHVPAQSGSDQILRAMNRRYTQAQYLGLLDQARSLVPDVAIAGDIIVGFPGETDQDFAETVQLVKKARYRNAFVFKYSPRPGTHSDKRLEDNITPEIKKQRNIELLAVQEKISTELAAEFKDKTVRVLVEGPSKKPHLNRAENNDNPQLIGRTEEDWIVVFNGPATLAGNFAEVKIEKTSPLTLFGKMA